MGLSFKETPAAMNQQAMPDWNSSKKYKDRRIGQMLGKSLGLSSG